MEGNNKLGWGAGSASGDGQEVESALASVVSRARRRRAVMNSAVVIVAVFVVAGITAGALNAKGNQGTRAAHRTNTTIGVPTTKAPTPTSSVEPSTTLAPAVPAGELRCSNNKTSPAKFNERGGLYAA